MLSMRGNSLLTGPKIWSPSGTAKAPPGQKSFCGSTTEADHDDDQYSPLYHPSQISLTYREQKRPNSGRAPKSFGTFVTF